MTVGIHVYYPPSGGEGLRARNESSAGPDWCGAGEGQHRRRGGEADRCQSSGKDGVFHSHSNLCVTQFDSVFIYGLPYGPASVLAIHPPRSLATTAPCQRAYICEVIPALAASKGPAPGSGGHGCRLPSGGADRGVDCRSVSF